MSCWWLRSPGIGGWTRPAVTVSRRRPTRTPRSKLSSWRRDGLTAAGGAGAGAPSGLVPAQELERLAGWPVEIARSDLAAYFSFSLEDLRWLRSHRGAGERIGLAVQLAAVRFLGFVPVTLGDTPPEVARHVGKEIGVAPATFTRYARDTDGRTRRRHVAAVVEHAGWRVCGQREWTSLARWLTER